MSPTHPTGSLLLLVLTAAIASAVAQDPPPVPPADREASRVMVATSTRRWAALGLRSGEVVVYDLEGGRRYQWQSPATSIRFLAIDPMGIGAVPQEPAGVSRQGPGAGQPIPVVLISAATSSGKKTSLYMLKGDDGIVLMEIRIPGPPAGLLVDPGEGVAYVFTGTPAERATESRPGRWTLRVVDVTAGKVEASLSLTGTVHGVALSPDGSRIYVGLTDGIRSFTSHPLKSSWMLRSPGRNRILRESGPLGSVLAVRDSQLAILNPDHLPPRDPETGASPDDDAILVVDLPFIGRFMDVNEETGEAIVLDARGTRMATIDLEGGSLSRVQQVPEVAAAAYHPSRESLLLFQQFGERVFELLHNPPDRNAVAAAPASPVPAASPTPGAVPAISGAGDAPPSRAPAAESRAASPEPPGPEPPGEGSPAGAPGPSTEPIPDPPLPAPRSRPDRPVADEGLEDRPAPVEPEEDDSEASPETTSPGEPLAGRVTGDLALVDMVVFYGPNAILREHARLRPGPDGTFALPEPPPGRYRVVLEGVDGIQLLCSPLVRQIVVGEEAVEALDFEVSGRIRAGILSN